MRKQRVLISGGGIAGLALAHCLVRDGHACEIIERARDFNRGGHILGFKGAGLRVMEHLGIREDVDKYNVRLKRSRFFTGKGRLLRDTLQYDPEETLGGGVFTRRAYVHRALYETLPDAVGVRFDQTIEAVTQNEGGVSARLSTGETLRGDFLAICDGVHSKLRAALFPNVKVRDYGGVYIGMYLTMPEGVLPESVDSYYGPSRVTLIMPFSNTQAAVVIYQDDQWGPTPDNADAAAWRAYLLQSFFGEAPALTRYFSYLRNEDELFFDRIRQVPVQEAVQGRIALVGDAGFCPTFMSGNGAALAAQCAYAFSKAVSMAADPTAAMARYEAKVSPVARNYQLSADKMRGMLFNRSSLKIWMRDLLMAHMPDWLAKQQIRKFYHSERTLSDLG